MGLPLPISRALKLPLTVLIVVPLVVTGVSGQQIDRRPSLPRADDGAAWRKPLDKLHRPANPQSEIDRAKRAIFGDPSKKLGLPSHGLRRQKAPDEPAAERLTLDPSVSHLDRDGDGSVSQSEYYQGRSRLTSPGIKGDRARERRAQRLRSQFRRTDLNGDGKVSPEEMQLRGSGRF